MSSHNMFLRKYGGGSSGGGWDWSKVTYQTSTVGQRKFARYNAISGNPDMGTVMSMNDGTDRNILVLDAQYRSNYKCYIDEQLAYPELLEECTNTGYFSGSSISLPCSGFSDATLNGSYSTICNQNTETSKYNTDNIYEYPPEYFATGYCRSITVNGIGCDLPNINVLIRIFCEMTMLDSLDPTVSSYSDYALSSWGFSDGCWSSSYYGEGYAISLNSNGYVEDIGQDELRGVCPILEI